MNFWVGFGAKDAERLTPYKDDKPKDAENSPFGAPSVLVVKAIDIALHSETLEEMVVYRALYGEQKLWVRPAHMWEEEVEVNGKTVKRFELISNSEQLWYLCWIK